MFENLCKALDDALWELDRKAAAGMLEDSDYHDGDMIAHFAKSLDTHVAMKEAGSNGYSNAAYPYHGAMGDSAMRVRTGRGNSYGDSRRRNDSMGNGYSRADRMDDVVQAMSGAMGDMPEDLRREAQRFMTKMQQQM